MPYGQGDLPLGLNDAKIASLTLPSTWGAVTDIMSVEMSRATLQLVSAIARGDDRITGAAAVEEGVELALRYTGLNIAAMAVMTGKSVTTISSVKQVQGVGGLHMPYFGIAVKANSADGTDVWVWFPQAKVMSNYTFFQGEYGAFTSPELTLQCVTNDDWGLYNIITHPSAVAITTFPPANIAEAS